MTDADSTMVTLDLLSQRTYLSIAELQQCIKCGFIPKPQNGLVPVAGGMLGAFKFYAERVKITDSGLQLNESKAPKIRRGRKKPYVRCTDAIRTERMEILVNLFSKHPTMTHGAKKRFIKENFGLDWRMAEIYIARTRKLMDQRAGMSQKESLCVVSGVFFDIMDHGNPHQRLAAASEFAKIKGLQAPTRVEHSGPAAGPIVVKDETEIPKLSRQRAAELISLATEPRELVHAAHGSNGNGSNGK